MDEQKRFDVRQAGLKKAVRERTVGYIIAALGLVAGLAWNDAVKSLIESVFPLKQNSLSAKFIYAIVITLVIVIFTAYLAKLFQEQDE